MYLQSGCRKVLGKLCVLKRSTPQQRLHSFITTCTLRRTIDAPLPRPLAVTNHLPRPQPTLISRIAAALPPLREVNSAASKPA